MIDHAAGFQRKKRAAFGIILIVMLAVAVDYYAVGEGLSYRELIVAFAALIGGIVVFGREAGIRFGFVLWALTLALGYRTVSVTLELPIHPAELLLWLLLGCSLAHHELLAGGRLRFPLWLLLFIPFWALAWWPMIAGDAPWDRMLNEFRNFLLIVPLLIVASVVLQRESYWRHLLLAFFAASTWIAVMGVIEYWFPDVIKMVPAFVGKAAAPTITAEGFSRAQFSFYGGPLATFVCVLALPFAIVLGSWWRQMLPRVAIVIASVMQILAIYIGGYRSIWLVLLIQTVIASLLRLRKHGVAVAFLCVAVAMVGYQFIPNTNERVFSGLAALRGAPIDHSAQDRKNRAMGALSRAIETPLGTGWSNAGWVHSDFLQVAANLGIIAGLIFLGGYIYTSIRLLRRVLPYLRINEGDLGFSLLLSFVGVGGLLAMEGVSVLPQLVLPAWFVWVLVEVWLRQTVVFQVVSAEFTTFTPGTSAELRPLDYPAGY